MMIADYRTRLRRPARDPIGTYRANFRGARFGHSLYNGYFAQKNGVDPEGTIDDAGSGPASGKNCCKTNDGLVLYDIDSQCCIRGEIIGNLTIDVKCRPVIGYPGKHCYIEFKESGGGAKTISAFWSYVFNNNGQIINHGKYINYQPDYDVGQGGSSIPFTTKGSKCEWLKCADEYARKLDFSYKYTAFSNSNTFIEKIFFECGGTINFPWNAIGGRDITDGPLPPQIVPPGIIIKPPPPRLM